MNPTDETPLPALRQSIARGTEELQRRGYVAAIGSELETQVTFDPNLHSEAPRFVDRFAAQSITSTAAMPAQLPAGISEEDQRRHFLARIQSDIAAQKQGGSTRFDSAEMVQEIGHLSQYPLRTLVAFHLHHLDPDTSRILIPPEPETPGKNPASKYDDAAGVNEFRLKAVSADRWVNNSHTLRDHMNALLKDNHLRVVKATPHYHTSLHRLAPGTPMPQEGHEIELPNVLSSKAPEDIKLSADITTLQTKAMHEGLLFHVDPNAMEEARYYSCKIGAGPSRSHKLRITDKTNEIRATTSMNAISVKDARRGISQEHTSPEAAAALFTLAPMLGATAPDAQREALLADCPVKSDVRPRLKVDGPSSHVRNLVDEAYQAPGGKLVLPAEVYDITSPYYMLSLGQELGMLRFQQHAGGQGFGVQLARNLKQNFSKQTDQNAVSLVTKNFIENIGVTPTDLSKLQDGAKVEIEWPKRIQPKGFHPKLLFDLVADDERKKVGELLKGMKAHKEETRVVAAMQPDGRQYAYWAAETTKPVHPSTPETFTEGQMRDEFSAQLAKIRASKLFNETLGADATLETAEYMNRATQHVLDKRQTARA